MANAQFELSQSGADAPLQRRNSHALGDRAGNFRLGHPTSTLMLRDFSNLGLAGAT
jgi:hypothetical protein